MATANSGSPAHAHRETAFGSNKMDSIRWEPAVLPCAVTLLEKNGWDYKGIVNVHSVTPVDV
jgi:hypothetical protein